MSRDEPAQFGKKPAKNSLRPQLTVTLYPIIFKIVLDILPINETKCEIRGDRADERCISQYVLAIL